MINNKLKVTINIKKGIKLKKDRKLIQYDTTSIENEIWKEIPGYIGLYEISNKGRIKHLSRPKKSNKDNFSNKEFIVATKISKGYTQVWLTNSYDIKSLNYVHKLVAMAFIDNPNNYKYVNHKDENKQNNNVENLEWCTASYNNSYNDKAIKAGEKNRIAVDIYSVKNNICKFLETLVKITDIKTKYGISYKAFYKYVNTNKVYRQRVTNKCFKFEYHDNINECRC
uniref:Homing endonuclease n=1 Tax=Geladintestivirus 5 TaxID=3233137 RepID=A0AAU8MH93_9CAUD